MQKRKNGRNDLSEWLHGFFTMWSGTFKNEMGLRYWSRRILITISRDPKVGGKEHET